MSLWCLVPAVVFQDDAEFFLVPRNAFMLNNYSCHILLNSGMNDACNW
uniref:Uncharacterized protein n=1 Tax=Arundo donax TaxID=35708 RepID=A0A0A8YRM4_ARUDO